MQGGIPFSLTLRDELLDVSRVELFILEQLLLQGKEDGRRCPATPTDVVPLAVAQSHRVLVNHE